MSMQVSLGSNQQQSFGNVNQDKMRTKAVKFVNAGDAEINRLVKMKYNKEFKRSDDKFASRISKVTNTLPLVAAASTLLAGRGAKAALKNGVSWGLVLAAPAMVSAVNKAVVKASPKVEKAEKNNPVASTVAAVGASLGAFYGLSAAADKIFAKPQVNAKLDSFLGSAKTTIGNVAHKVAEKFGSTKLASGLSGLAEKAKNVIPTVAKENISKVVNGKYMSGAKKFALNNAPALLVAGAFGAMIGKAVSDGKKMSAIKSDVKDAQFKTAKVLVNTFAAENNALKEENAVLTGVIASSENNNENA